MECGRSRSSHAAGFRPPGRLRCHPADNRRPIVTASGFGHDAGTRPGGLARGDGDPSSLCGPLENFFQRFLKHPCNAKRHLERWGVLAGFDGVDGLAGDADLVGKVLLRHFAVVEAEDADLVGDWGARHVLLEAPAVGGELEDEF